MEIVKELCPAGCDLTGAQMPTSMMEFHSGRTNYSRRIGVEVQGVYNGVLFYKCPKCNLLWHRFEEGTEEYELAEPIMAQLRRGQP